MFATRTLLPAVALATFLQSPLAHAAVFAQFTPDTAAFDYSWINHGTGGDFISIVSPSSTVPQGVATHFSFLDPALAALVFLPATFTLDASATASPAINEGGGLFTEKNINGTFSFIYSGATQTIDGITLTHNVTNLLSGLFTDAWIQGAGGSGSANRSAPVGSLSYTSDVEKFHGIRPSQSEFAFNLLSVTPPFGAASPESMNSFKAAGGGNFSFVAIPEPTAWTLMIMGFGLAGAGLRARRRFAST
jgi:hypothetical protein